MDGMTDQKDVRHIPPGLHIMQNIVRSTKYSTHTKCFLNTETTLSLTQHNAGTCLENVPCFKHVVDTSRAHTQHYRKTCPDPLKNECKTYKEHVVKDTRVWKHLEYVIKNVKITFDKLGLH